MTLDDRRVGIAIEDSIKQIEMDDCYNIDLVNKLIHNALIYGGLGESDPSAPLTDIIKPGMTVLVKPNWVLHYNHSGKGMECLVTHPNFIESVVLEILKAKPEHIIIADAPIQSCDFSSLVTDDWKEKIRSIAFPTRVNFIDFRRTIAFQGTLSFSANQNVRDEDNYVMFDLGKESLLEPVTTPANSFRITCYKPDDLAKTHNVDCHKYLISRDVFDADVIINLPKLKCHKKAGITAALKNLVGINGNKEFLPHHRLGGSLRGGDCYPGKSFIKFLAELCYDAANRNINKIFYYIWRIIARALLLVQSKIFGDAQLEGSWYGNDTVWRMVLDLNRIALYGDKYGSLSDTPLRNIYSITDGIIAGEGNGPLAPEPVKLGAVTFASSSAFAEVAHAALMKFDWEKIPLILNAFGRYRYPLTSQSANDIKIIANDRHYTIEELSNRYGLGFMPPEGWKGHIELG